MAALNLQGVFAPAALSYLQFNETQRIPEANKMAFVSTAQHAQGAARFAAAIETLTRRVNQYRLYRRTLAELAELSDRERSELGFSRQSPRAAAYEAVYGVRG
ncbi:MAG: DUF1127 domain-containing protein [Paracoccaceae bacterium]